MCFYLVLFWNGINCSMNRFTQFVLEAESIFSYQSNDWNWISWYKQCLPMTTHKRMKKLFEGNKKIRPRTLSRSREKEVTLEKIVKHKEELLSMLQIEESNFVAKKESIERSLVEVEKHEILLRYNIFELFPHIGEIVLILTRKTFKSRKWYFREKGVAKRNLNLKGFF